MKYRILSPSIFFSAAIGNVLEFYDFATYGFLIPIIAPLFFPAINPLNSLLMAYGVFAVSFLVRPIGGLLFGYIGDFYGRKVAFSLSLILMAAATTMIGLLPGYDRIGLLAPFLLILCRLLQGLCLGGEFSGSLIFAVEHHNQNSQKSAFMTGSITAAGVSGWFLSSLVCFISIHLGISWRIPFLLGAFVGLIGYYVRRSLPEVPTQLVANVHSVWNIKKIEWLTAGSIAGIGALMGGIFYGLHIFPNSFLPTHFPSISHSQALRYTTFGIGVYMFFLPFMGLVADYIRPTKSMQFFSCLTILLSYPIITLLMSGSFYSIILAEVLASVTLAGFMAPATFVMAQSFFPSVRYRLVSLSYNVGACLLGGTTPSIFLFFTEKLHLLYGPAFYLGACGIIALLSSYFLDKQLDLASENKDKKLFNSPSFFI